MMVVRINNTNHTSCKVASRMVVGTIVMLICCQGIASPSEGSSAVATMDEAATTSAELVRLIEMAEHAYTEVDFSAVRESAARALALGRASSEQSSRLHVMLGIANSALGQDVDAKRHFTAALAIDPQLDLDRSLSPKLRAPYLEAKGFWERHRSRLGMTLRFGDVDSAIACTLVDPAKLVKTVRIWVRSPGDARYEPLQSVAKSSFVLYPHQPMKRRKAEYYAALLDDHGNTLLELGETNQPLRLGDSADDRPPHALDAAGGMSPPEPRQTRSYWLPATLGASALAAASMGVYFNVQREAAAAEWNGKDCERPGTTRLQQCGDIDERRRAAERLTIGLYSAGGLFLIGSLGTWLWGGGDESRGREKAGKFASQVSCNWLVGGAQVECVGRF